MDENGYGRCRKRDHTHTGGRTLVHKKFDPFTCYVDDSTYCSDSQDSSTTTVAGKKKSALGCEGKYQI